MVIHYALGKWKFTHVCAQGRHTEGPFTSSQEAEDALNKHKEKCGD